MLDKIAALIDWQPIAAILASLYPTTKEEAAWPPLSMFRAMLLAVWYDLSDVRLAGTLDDRTSFRRFCGFSAHEPTPERTTFVRFHRELASRSSLDQALFEAVMVQLKARAIRIRTGTIVDATIIASQTERDDEARWVKHKGKRAVYGFKAHVGADATPVLVERIAITPANINDGRAGPDAVPDDPGEVSADSACRGNHFRDTVRSKGGTLRVAATAMWGRDERETLARLKAWNDAVHQTRSRIEKIFGTWKRSYGLRRMR
ncbi:IS5 family transposase [Acetobacter oeni]|uniref:IS5 family transposase n=1 Tax=Acetobacter oeni TaxID=304077 RepID=A0A511XPE2_9PROT|nr:IS5 family transposase [Acetobacter oeni]MBB3884632.1 IS5 family transposase [Acetobacter oeni]GBR05016.1 transposase [Acetobacter oeni LMG 21952]GEN64830.1 hypothetical protein AOE01nite_30540 [Acetobacter oeni]